MNYQEKILFQKRDHKNNAWITYCGTINQFFGLLAEAGDDVVLTPGSHPTPPGVQDAPSRWEMSGILYRQKYPDNIYMQYVEHAKKPDREPGVRKLDAE